jgi:hypothetical protein
MRNSYILLARFTPNSILHHGEWVFFSGATPSQKTRLIWKEYSVLQHNMFTSIGSTGYTTQLINPFHASALSNQNRNSRFSIGKKIHPKASVHADPPCLIWLISSSSGTVILHCEAITLLPTLRKNL